MFPLISALVRLVFVGGLALGRYGSFWWAVAAWALVEALLFLVQTWQRVWLWSLLLVAMKGHPMLEDNRGSTRRVICLRARRSDFLSALMAVRRAVLDYYATHDEGMLEIVVEEVGGASPPSTAARLRKIME